MSKVRIKFHRFSGDLSKQAKIWMLERARPFYPFPWQLVSRKDCRSFQRTIRMRERAVFKRQTRRLIWEQTEDE